MSAKNTPANLASPSNQAASTADKVDKLTNAQAFRETVESVVVAVILAFLFRTFVAEAFVIPTGSMAPTLRGTHKDIACPQCSYHYQASASSENDDGRQRPHDGVIRAATCPICRYTIDLSKTDDPYLRTFTGDRILVSKFSYDLGEPSRWDVIVFKFPGNAKQNYIKRLVGLPNELVRLRHGDVFVKSPHDRAFQIARKPPHKIKAMLQLVDDTQYVADALKQVQWPSRWQPWPAVEGGERRAADDVSGMTLVAAADQTQWRRYRHLVPTEKTWRAIEGGADKVAPAPEKSEGELITDLYAYNSHSVRVNDRPMLDGMHWVGDLAAEFDVELQSSAGRLLLDLVEGGVHFQVAFDVANGQAKASIVAADFSFSGPDGPVVSDPVAMSPLRGPGRHSIRFSNVDDELRVWVDDDLLTFDQPTTYRPHDDVRPKFTPEDPGDLAPVGIGVQGAKAHVHQARVLRDIYYIATKGPDEDFGPIHEHDYQDAGRGTIRDVLADPKLWETTDLFGARRTVEFDLLDDEFFPMGDNSPQSSDARIWPARRFVARELLTGKAVLVYWPHALPRPVPFIPNIRQMRFIR